MLEEEIRIFISMIWKKEWKYQLQHFLCSRRPMTARAIQIK